MKAFQVGLDLLSRWSSDHDLQRNMTKFRLIIFTKVKTFERNLYIIDGVVVKNIGAISDLGVTLDYETQFTKHDDLLA